MLDGASIQLDGCLNQAIGSGMNEDFANEYCLSIGYSSGLQAQMSPPGTSGTVIGFDINGQSSVPAGYPGDGGNEGNLLAVLVLDSEYTGYHPEVAVTISDFIVSGVNPFTGTQVALTACDADLNPLNGCFDVDVFQTPVQDFPYGDLNLDGAVNILDVVVMVNIVIGVELELSGSDLNQDGIVNVLDVVLLINVILS